MKKLLLTALVLTLSGCAQSTAEKVDVKNSPCACVYDGRQLSEPSSDLKLEIIKETKGIV
jgi:PBP1b-binding outer membrane lipoprotein LpoB